MPAGWAIAVVVLGVAVVAQAVVLLGLMRQVTPLLEQLADKDDVGKRLMAQGPAIGSRLPDFTALGADGEVSASDLHGQPAVLLFLGVGCGPCQKLATEMGQSELGQLASQLIIVTGPDGRRELGIPSNVTVLAEQNREVSDRLSVVGTPFAIAVDPDGIVLATRVPNTMSQLSEFTDILEGVTDAKIQV